MNSEENYPVRTFQEFFESIPENTKVCINEMTKLEVVRYSSSQESTKRYTTSLIIPTLEVFCEFCAGKRIYECDGDTYYAGKN